MNTRLSHRRPRRKQLNQASARAKKRHLFETLEMRAAPGSVLVGLPLPLASLLEDPAVEDTSPTPDMWQFRRSHASPDAESRELGGLAPVRTVDLGTSQFTTASPEVVRDSVVAQSLGGSDRKSRVGARALFDELPAADFGSSGTESELSRMTSFMESSSSGSATLPDLGGPSSWALLGGVTERTAVRKSSAAGDAGEGRGVGVEPVVSSTVDVTMAASSAGIGGVGAANDTPVMVHEVHSYAQNPANHLDVNVDARVTPLDALQVVNELNRVNGASLSPASAVSTASTESAPAVMLDVNGDSHLSPLDALMVINHLNRGAAPAAARAESAPHMVSVGFDNGLDDWQITEVGGFAPNQGTVRVGSAILTEGNSFLVSIDREITIPASPLSLIFDYEDHFDSSDQGAMRDAFEATLLGGNGTALVHAFAPNREAFFNLTEELSPAGGQGVTVTSTAGGRTRVTLDLSQVFAGTTASLQFRLVNNDADTQSTVRILDVFVTSEGDEPPAVSVQLANDTAPTGSPPSLLNDRLTNDPRIVGTATDDNEITQLQVQLDDSPFVDITASLVAGRYSYDPGTLEPGAHRVVVRATNVLSQTSESALDFTLNTPPVADAGGDRTVDEGDVVAFVGSGSSDSEDTLFGYMWEFHDGTSVAAVDSTYTYVQDGLFPVSLTVTDTAGSERQDTAVITVRNLPAVVQPMADQQTFESQSLTISTSFSDPGLFDTHAASIDWGDGTPPQPAQLVEQQGTGTISGTHVYRNDGLYTVIVRVSDSDGAESTTEFNVQVTNLAPIVTSANDLTGDEGQSLDLVATFTDAGVDDTHTATIWWNDGTQSVGSVVEADGVGTVTAAHVFGDNGVYPIRVDVTDSAGDTGSRNASASIVNVAPRVVVAADQIVAAGLALHLDVATFIDPGFSLATAGTQESFTAVINWGDGMPEEPGSLVVIPGAAGIATTGVISGTHTYASPGQYTVLVTVTDDDGGTDAGQFVVRVASMTGTKFFVVDQSAHDTFRYDPAGNVIGQSDLVNSRPRGVASNLAGDTVWVIDANKTVYVYDASGNVLGSWQAKGLHQPQDITTDGTDIWIVDDAKDQVYRYANAATRRAGSQSPTSRFSLFPHYSNPTGIVTNGSLLWITDDHAQVDMVYVYNLAGCLQGLWRLDPANGAPSGITLDPSGGDDLWVVDRHDAVVYHYANSLSRRAGSQAATDAFPLAVGNQHPEGIADPPTIVVTSPSPSASFAAGSTVLVTGHASAPVVINGQSVEAFDAAGNFFSQVPINPGQNSFTLTATDAFSESASEVLTLTGTQPANGLFDFSALSDVSDSFVAEYARTSFDAGNSVLYADVSVRNAGQYDVRVPLYVGVTNISDPRVRMRDADGMTPDGVPVVDFTALILDGSLAPNEITGATSLAFDNPERIPFTYDLVFLGMLNRAPTIVTVPDLEVIVGSLYSYDVNATDVDGDLVTFDLIAGPTGLTLDAATGELRWSPTISEIGLHSVAIQASDGRGGSTQQGYLLKVMETPPNRPPIIVSIPVTTAHVSDGENQGATTYVYDVGADDPDLDSLHYSLTGYDRRSSIVTFGSGANTFTMEFVPIGSPGNPADMTGYFKPAGSVDYAFQMGKFEFSRDMFVKANALGGLGITLGDMTSYGGNGLDRPATGLSWNEAARFVNWLNTSQGYPAAYKFAIQPGEPGYSKDANILLWQPGDPGYDATNLFRNSLANYVLPDVDEWYKSAYFDPRTSAYFDFATGSDIAPMPVIGGTLPNTAVYDQSPNQGPADITQAGGLSPFRTMGQTGNAYEWLETEDDRVNDVGSSLRIALGGAWDTPASRVASSVAKSEGYPFPDFVGMNLSGGVRVVSRAPLNAPQGLAIDSNTGVVSWAPTPEQMGEYEIAVAISDGRGGLASQGYTLRVLPSLDNHAPMIVSLPTTNITVGRPYSYDVIGLDPDNDELTYSLVDAPAGMQIDSATGNITWASPATALDFSTLPSAQGWTYRALGNESPESSIFSVDGSLLHQNTIGMPSVNQGGNGYALDGVVDPSLPFVLSIRARIVEEELINNHPFGFGLYVYTGTEAVGIGIGAQRIQSADGEVLSTTIDNTVFHDYRLQGTPGVGYELFVDDALVGSGDLWATSVNGLYFGDSTGGTNARVDIAQYSFYQSPRPVKVRVDDGRGGVDEQAFDVTLSDDTGEVQGHVFEVADPSIISLNVTNHSFEVPDVDDGTWTFGAPFGNVDVPGWSMTVQGGSFLGVGVFDPSDSQYFGTSGNGTPIPGADGHQVSFINLPYGGHGSLTSDVIAATKLGAVYTLTVALGNRLDTSVDDLKISLLADGQEMAYIFGSGELLPNGAFTDVSTTWQASVPDAALQVRLEYSKQGAYQESQINFDNVRLVEKIQRPPGLIGHTVYVDENRNGRRDLNERFTLTDDSGNYQFSGLAADQHVIALEGKRGWETVTPPGGSHTVTLADGQVELDRDFRVVAVPIENRPPVIADGPPREVTIGHNYRYDVAAHDVDGDSLVFDLLVKPDGMVIDPIAGVATWKPNDDQIGSHDVILRVSDGQGGVDLQAFQVMVKSANTPPVITSTPPGPATAGLPYQYAVRAQDADGDPLTFSLSTAPAGMTTDPNTGVLDWIATETALVTILVRDQHGGEARQVFDLAVETGSTNRNPLISSEPRTAIQFDSVYRYDPQATDPDGDPLSYSLEVAPTGMSVDPQGLVTWRPTVAQVGTHQVVLRVADGRGGEALRDFVIAVSSQRTNASPSIHSTPPQAAIAGKPYAYDAFGTDPDGDPLLWAFDQAPAGMSLDEFTGAIRWTPQASQFGSHEVRLLALDGQGGVAEQRFTITVTLTNTPPGIISTPPTQAFVGQMVTYAVRARDIDGDALTFTVYGPATMTIDPSTGVLRWTPEANLVGIHEITVVVSDGQSSGTQTFDLDVSGQAANGSPVITSLPPTNASVGQVYSYPVTALDPDGDLITYRLDVAPAGMNIDSASGLLTWTPTLAQSNAPQLVSIVASDNRGGIGWQSFTLTPPVNAAPVITSTLPSTATPGSVYRYDVRATDPNNDRLSYELVTAPSGMTIDGYGRLRWTPAIGAVGSVAVALRVSDGRGGVDNQQGAVSLAPDAVAPQVLIQVSTNPTPVGEPVTVVVSATDNVGVHALELTVGGIPVVLDSHGVATITPNTVGPLELIATAQDATGNPGTASVSLSVFDPADVDAPQVELTSPEPDTIANAPTEIRGTVTDTNLLYYTLSVAPVGSDTFVEFARGTGPVLNGVLGRLDTSTLVNDSYRLRLFAVDAGGNESTDERVVHVAGNLKLGNFTLSFTDLTIPVSGIPITVTRTYDSFLAGRQDELGYGWRLEVRDADLRTSVPRTGMEDYLIYNAFYDGARVYVTLPGGKREGFTFRPQRATGYKGSMLGIFYAKFVPDAGVTSELSVPRFDLMASDSGQMIDAGSGTPYNPSNSIFGGRYVITTEDGLAYEIDGRSGDLVTVTDTSDNTVSFTDDGIISSTGKSVTFERDPQGRIAAVLDPAGNRIRYEYDARGDLTAVTDREGNTTRFEYRTDRPHYLEQIIDPLGRIGVRSEYDEQGRLVKLFDADGQAVEMLHDPDHFVETVKDQLGNPTVYEYDTLGNVVREVDALGGITLRTYSDPHDPTLETSVTDPLGRTTYYTYDDRGNVLSETDPLGHVTLTTYQSISFGTTILAKMTGQSALPFRVPLTTTDPLGNTTTNAYDSRGNLLSMTDPSGMVTSMAYDLYGNPTVMSFGGGTTSFEYDSVGQVLKQIDALGNATTYTYDANGNQLTSTTSLTTPTGVRSLVTTTDYDAAGRVIKVTDAEGGVTQSEYDAAGNKTADVDALGRRTAYRYDERGLLIETIFADATPADLTDNPRTRTEYDAAGREIATIDEEGRRTATQYDALGRLVATIYPDATPANPLDNPRTATEYDAAGRVKAQIDERGNRTEFEYDAAGRQIVVRDALGHETATTYDIAGRQLEVADALNHVTRFTYDASGRQVETFFHDGTKSTNGYDASGRLASRTDQLNRTTEYEYDAAGRLTAVVDALGQRTVYGYDEAGNLVTQQDANGHITHYEYDGLGRRVATELPLGQRSTTAYNQVGNVTSTTDFNGDTIELVYDARNRLLAKEYPDGTSVSFTYTLSGQRETYTDARGTTHWTYDDRDRLVSRTDPDGQSLSYTYDAAGNRTALTSMAGTVSYSFDALNRLETVIDPEAGITQYQYNAVSNLVRTDFPNGTSETRQYDDLNRLLFLENRGPEGVISSYAYTLAATGRRDSVVEADGRQVEYDYDALDRLTQEHITDAVFGDRTIDYTYDPVGNRLSRSDSAEVQTDYTYDANDRLLTETMAAEISQYTYDDNGNSLSKISAADRVFYDWDFENRLIAADTDGDGTADVTNQYDADGIRISQTVGGEETRFLIDTVQPYQQVVAEYTPGGVLKVSYVHGLDLISQNRLAADNVTRANSFYHVDGLGSTRALSGSFGLITDRYLYDAFGRTIGQVGSTGNVYLFSGEQRDLATGLDYLRARWMQPRLGRFVSRDRFPENPIRSASLHRYLYGENNPANAIDPTGEYSILGTIIATTVVGALVGAATKGLLHAAANQRVLADLLSGNVTSQPVKEFADQLWDGARRGAVAGFISGVSGPWIAGTIGMGSAGAASAGGSDVVIQIYDILTDKQEEFDVEQLAFSTATGFLLGALLVPKTSTTNVTNWGPSSNAGLANGKWVMIGGNNRITGTMSGTTFPKPLGMGYSQSSGVVYQKLPTQFLKYPIEQEGLIFGILKGLQGQRIYSGPTILPPAP